MLCCVVRAVSFVMVAGIVTIAPAMAADPVSTAKRKADAQRRKIEHQQRVAEMQRTQAPHRGQPLDATAGASSARDFRGNPIGWQAAKQEERRDFRGNPVGGLSSTNTVRSNKAGDGSGSGEAIAFNVASAPPPADSLMSFVKLARTAGTMDQLLPFLPAGKQESLKSQQANYDPKQAAKSRLEWRQRNPGMAEDSITFLTNSPYTNELSHYKSIGDRVLDVLSVKVDGNKAKIVVATKSDAVINGGKYPYGKADIELVGEGNSWKFGSYNDSILVYQEKPQ